MISSKKGCSSAGCLSVNSCYNNASIFKVSKNNVLRIIKRES